MIGLIKFAHGISIRYFPNSWVSVDMRIALPITGVTSLMIFGDVWKEMDYKN